MQRVLGYNPRLPNSILSDDAIDPQYTVTDPLADFQRSEELRRAATRAWAATENRSRVLKALRARHRIDQHFKDGDMIFVWRQPRVGEGRWHGPGVIILCTAGGAYVNMRGSLWRVCNEQMRLATSEESLGGEIVNKYLHEFKNDIRRTRGQRQYVDVRREGAPRIPELEIVPDPARWQKDRTTS